MDNPLLSIRFEVPFDRIRAEHVEPAVDQLIEEAGAAIAGIVADDAERTYASTLGALEDALEPLGYAMTVVGHLESVATYDALRDAYNAAQPKASAFWTRIPLNAGLYGAIRSFSESEEASSLEPTRARHLKKTLDEFRRHGAELEGAEKERLEEVDLALTKACTRFSQNVLDATNAFELIVEDESRLAGLPESAKAMARQDAEAKGLAGFRFTLQAPSLIPVLTYLDDAAIREEISRAYHARATSGDLDNRALVGEILSLRAQKAALLGYEDFSDLVLEDRMAEKGEKAKAFVDDLRERTQTAFDRENDDLLAFRRSLDGEASGGMKTWDLAYYAEKQRKALYDFDEEELRPYFPAARVLEGLFEIVGQLYGIRIVERPMPAWDESVRAFAIEGATGEHLASFYVDLYPRENKRGGAWMNALVTGAVKADSQEPHLGLFCANMNPPVGDQPALLTHREVETLFHEFGHLLHHALTRVTVKSLAGTNVAWDFVELPSQIMENWCWEREALDLFARHHETGEAIPEALFEKMSRARTYRAANAQMRQLGFAGTDLALHREYDAEKDGDVMAYARALLAPHSPAELGEDYGMIAGFTHLFASPTGYAAGYYSYKWAEVLDADAFTRFKKEGIVAPEVGHAFRRSILERGDSRDPGELFREFMGREPSLDALLARLGLAA